MNWLGKLIQKQINKNDTVLSLGCGIYNEIMGLKCRSILGVEIEPKFIEIATRMYPTIRHDITKGLDIFPDNSFDIVLALDVIEHLPYDKAIMVIDDIKRITRDKAIVYTPSVYVDNNQNVIDTWGIVGIFDSQKHLSFLSPNLLQSYGYKTTFPEPDKNTLAIWSKYEY